MPIFRSSRIQPSEGVRMEPQSAMSGLARLINTISHCFRSNRVAVEALSITPIAIPVLMAEEMSIEEIQRIENDILTQNLIAAGLL